MISFLVSVTWVGRVGVWGTAFYSGDKEGKSTFNIMTLETSYYFMLKMGYVK